LLKRGKKADLLEGVELADRIVALAEAAQRNYTTMLALVLGAFLYWEL